MKHSPILYLSLGVVLGIVLGLTGAWEVPLWTVWLSIAILVAVWIFIEETAVEETVTLSTKLADPTPDEDAVTVQELNDEPALILEDPTVVLEEPDNVVPINRAVEETLAADQPDFGLEVTDRQWFITSELIQRGYIIKPIEDIWVQHFAAPDRKSEIVVRQEIEHADVWRIDGTGIKKYDSLPDPVTDEDISKVISD